MDQDQLSAIVVAVLIASCIFGCWIKHLQDRARTDERYDLQEELEV